MLSPLADGLTSVLIIILNFVQLLVIASVVVSWVGADPSNPIVNMIRNLTEPIYRPIRKLTKNIPGPFDWAPFIIILLVVFIERGLIPYIKLLAR